ncbi:MAG: alpha/beta fold hydrolase [Pseudomonadota bacterium]
MQHPVVFLPGLMSDARAFEPLVAAFSVHVPVMVALPVGAERIEEIASGIITSLPRRFNLVGHAMGGAVAMEIWRRAPDRVNRMVLMDTSPLAETPQTASDYEAAIIKLRAGRLDEAVEMLMPRDALAPGELRVHLMGLVHSMAAHLGAEAIIRQIRAVQRRRDHQSALRRCDIPVLVACGAYDRLTPVKRHELMADLIPDARLRVFQGSGHLPMLEQPDEVLFELFEFFQGAAAIS